MKKRLIYIDRLKGFAIYLVVFGHIYQKMIQGGMDYRIFSVIYSFHMPLFFFLSGYVSQKTNKINTYKEASQYLVNKVGNLIVPFLIWALLNYMLFSSIKDFSFLKLYSIIVKQFSEPSLWFLLMLFKIFIAYVPFHLISQKYKEKNSLVKDLGLILSTCIIVVVLGKVFHISSALTFLLNYLFFMFGVLLDKHKTINNKIQTKLVFIIASIAFIGLVGFYEFNLSHLVKTKLLKLTLSFFAIISLYNLSIKIKLPKAIDTFLAKIGKWTMVIYTTHFLFFNIVNDNSFFPENLNLIIEFVGVSLLSIILIYSNVLIGLIVDKIPVLNFLLYGRLIKGLFNKNKNI